MSGGGTLRLVWPQWQGAGPEIVGLCVPEFPLATAQLGYTLGTTILEAIAPAADGPVAVVPVDLSVAGLTTTDGVFAREVIVRQLDAALSIIDEHSPERIVTLGGECSVSVAPFSYLAGRYGDDLAVIWMDSHPDVGLPSSGYDGYHAMAVSHLIGKGDGGVVDALPATVDPSRIALAGLHAWTDDDIPHVRDWGLRAFSPAELSADSSMLIDWLRATGCTRVAIHLDVDTVDSNDIILGLGIEPGGLSRESVIRVLGDIASVADVVAITIAEYVPRQAIALGELIARLPLIGTSARSIHARSAAVPASS